MYYTILYDIWFLALHASHVLVSSSWYTRLKRAPTTTPTGLRLEEDEVETARRTVTQRTHCAQARFKVWAKAHKCADYRAHIANIYWKHTERMCASHRPADLKRYSAYDVIPLTTRTWIRQRATVHVETPPESVSINSVCFEGEDGE